MKIAVAALARDTFDLDAAGRVASGAVRVVDAVASVRFGSAELLTDRAAVEQAAAHFGEDVDVVVLVHATFSDSTLAVAAAATTDAPVVLWSAPEARTGERLRRNSLCGANLAGYAFGRRPRRFTHIHVDPDADDATAALRAAVSMAGEPAAEPVGMVPDTNAGPRAVAAVQRLARTRVGVLGAPPDGFEPCAVDVEATRAVLGVDVEARPLDELFTVAEATPARVVDDLVGDLSSRLDLTSIAGMDFEPSVRLHAGLVATVDANGWDAVATRCWPECFTEFGGAACAAQSFLNEDHGVPGLCEADAYGAITSLLLQWLGDGPAFVADLVDADPADDTAVVWHCGVAPVSMAADSPRGARHQNRGLPLLTEFALRPGLVTVARLSQSRHRTRLVVGRAEMLDRPRPFAGTAGTLRFERPVGDVLATVMAEGLEHHYGIVYGDVVDDLHGVAAQLGLPVVAL